LRKLLSIAIISCLLASCSFFEFSEDEGLEDPFTLNSVEIALSRASLGGGSEYEHYQLSNGLFFHECGTLRFGKRKMAERGIHRIKPKTPLSLSKAARELVFGLTEAPSKWEKSGSATNFGDITDPGVLNARISYRNQNEERLKVEEFTTSVDSIASSSKVQEKRLRNLIEILRSIPSKPLCNNLIFFGLKRVKPGNRSHSALGSHVSDS
jgi:hypothetical protein